jgi:hypothetical protein
MVTGQGFCWKFDFDSLKFESEFLFHILLVWIYVIYLCCLLYKIDCVCEYFVWCLSRLACFYCTISLWTMLHDLFWSSVLLCTLHFFFSCHGINYWLCYGIMMNFPNISHFPLLFSTCSMFVWAIFHFCLFCRHYGQRTAAFDDAEVKHHSGTLFFN